MYLVSKTELEFYCVFVIFADIDNWILMPVIILFKQILPGDEFGIIQINKYYLIKYIIEIILNDMIYTLKWKIIDIYQPIIKNKFDFINWNY